MCGGRERTPLLAKGPQFSTIFNFFFLLPHLFESSHKGFFFFTLLNQVDLLSSSSSSFREKGGETVIYATPRLFVFFFLTSFPFFFLLLLPLLSCCYLFKPISKFLGKDDDNEPKRYFVSFIQTRELCVECSVQLTDWTLPKYLLLVQT